MIWALTQDHLDIADDAAEATLSASLNTVTYQFLPIEWVCLWFRFHLFYWSHSRKEGRPQVRYYSRWQRLQIAALLASIMTETQHDSTVQCGSRYPKLKQEDLQNPRDLIGDSWFDRFSAKYSCTICREDAMERKHRVVELRSQLPKMSSFIQN